jgi:phenylacetate-CoA ligase
MVWPAVTRPDEATALALQYELGRSQWLPADDIRELQLRQLDALLRHAYETVPFYRWHWHGAYDAGSALTYQSLERLPLLRRDDVERQFDALRSGSPPAEHGAISEVTIADGRGNPVRVLSTEIAGLWSQVLALRDHLWHRRDFSGTLAEIRAGAPERDTDGWGPASRMIEGMGRSLTLDVRTSRDAQLDWLKRHEPDYLLTPSSNVRELARLSLERGIRLSRLREVRTVGEPADVETRELCRRAWNVPLTDVYASEEAGCLALQCPVHEHYHVQSETVLLEVLDERNRACAPGTVGRVVVTALHNYAMPLVRYDLGDLAEAGNPCACGRGLPVLRRIVSRTPARPATAPAHYAT